MGSLVASSSTSSVALQILIVLLLAALASVAAADAANGGGTIYKVGDDAGWIERFYTEDSLDVYYNVWSSTKKFYVGDTVLFVYDPNDWDGHNSVLQVTPTAYDTCADSDPIAVYTTGHDYVTLDHPGQYYFISHYGCLHGHNMLDIYVQPRPPHHANNGNDFIPLAPTLAASPSSSSASSSPSPDHYDSISVTTTTTSTPPSHSTSASASASSSLSTSLPLGMLAATIMVIFLS